MKSQALWVFGLILIGLVGCQNKEAETALTYPVTQKVDTVDVYFGTEVPDPYRWLENDTAKATAD